VQTFADKNKNIWIIDLSIGLMEVVKARLGVDLLDPVDEEKNLLVNLSPVGSENIMLFCNMLYLLCEEQCKGLELDSEQFGMSLSSTSLNDAYKAFFKEWEDFFLSLGRKDLAEAMKRMRELIAEGMEEAAEEIRKVTYSSLKGIQGTIEK